MTQKSIKRFIYAGVLGVAVMVAPLSCKDDHFDIQDNGQLGANATLTLWQQIQSNPQLSTFANILARTPYFKDEKHPIAGYTFREVLNSNQIMTVFAPTNDAFTLDDIRYYDSLLNVRPYYVFLRLVGNHIARNNYVATGTGVDNIIMVNGKKATFDRAQHKLKELTFIQSNIPATNGTLHLIDQQSSFAYNIYEYIRAHDIEYRYLNAWLEAHDTVFFNASASAEAGANPETGEPVYVDSVYTRYNSLYGYNYQPASQDWEMYHKGFSESLESEDSLYIMILPSDAAWESAQEKMTPWYVYGPKYFDMTKIDDMVKDDNAAKKAMIREVPDTLWKDAITMDLASPLLFNIRVQPRSPIQTGVWTLEDFIAKPLQKMFNSRSDTFFVKPPLTDVRPYLFPSPYLIGVSNGVICPTDIWPMINFQGANDVEIKIDNYSIFQNGRYNLNTNEQKVRTYIGDYQRYTFNSSTSKLVKDSLLGAVSENYFYYFSKGGSAAEVKLKLLDRENNRQIKSGIDYEIGVVMVPDFYRINPDSIVSATAGTTPFKKDTLRVEFTYMDETGTEKTGSGLTPDNVVNSDKFNLFYAGQKVDTVWVKDKTGANATIRFPVSYMNLKYAYPVMGIKSNNITSKLKQLDYQPEFSIDRVILRAKEE